MPNSEETHDSVSELMVAMADDNVVSTVPDVLLRTDETASGEEDGVSDKDGTWRQQHNMQKSHGHIATNSNTLKRKKSSFVDGEVTTTAATTEWVLVQSNDCPYVSWSDNAFQYTLHNPANRGDKQLKLQLYDDNRPVNKCGFYLNTKQRADMRIYNVLVELLTKLEARWLHADANTMKTNGIIPTVGALPLWRIANSLDGSNDKNKRKSKIVNRSSDVVSSSSDSGSGGASAAGMVTKQKRVGSKKRRSKQVVSSPASTKNQGQ